MAPPKQDPFLMAVNHHRAGNLAAASQGYRAILARHPNHGGALHYLGLIALQSGQPQEAFRLINKAASLYPNDEEIHYNLANVCNQLGQGEEAVNAFGRACRLQPNMVAAFHNLANTLVRLGRLGEAMETYTLLLQRWPQEVNARRNLALAQLESGQPAVAMATLLPLLEQTVIHGEVHALAARIHQADCRFGQAIFHCQQALLQMPQSVAVRRTLAAVQLSLGLPSQALATCRQAMALGGDSDMGRMLLNTLLYDGQVSLPERWQEHQTFATRFAPTADGVRFNICPDKITIGILSADLRQHVIARNLLPILEHYDRQRFAIHCFADVAQPDEIGKRIATLVDGWHCTVGLSDLQVAELIRQQGVAILLVTAGRFDRNRPLVAAHRAAPLQISWHDPASSGLPMMDGLLADRHLVPRNSGEMFSERVIRLPNFFLHHPLTEAPAVNPLPMVSNGHVSFISCNNPAKLNDKVLTLWAKLLARIPDSVLILKYRHWLGDPLLVERIHTLFAQAGVDKSRVQLVTDQIALQSHLSIYHQADIALDPFPFCGSTTTFESLWMGVPVVTLPGPTMVSRWTAAMLHPLQLTGWIANDEEKYIKICQDAIANPDALAHLRKTLTTRLATSPLCNGRRWTRHWQRVMVALHRQISK